MDKIVSTERVKKLISDLLLDNLNDLIFIIKVDENRIFRYLYVNDAGMRLGGIKSDYYDRDLYEVHQYKQARKLEKRYLKIVKTKQPLHFLETKELQNGQVYYGDCTIIPVKDNKENVTYLIETVRNVTDLVYKNIQIGRKKQLYQSIVDNNMDGILHLNLDGNITNSNPVIQKITGYTKKQIVRRSIFNLVPDSELAIYKQIIEQTKKGESLETFDCRFVHRNGHTILIQLKTVPIVIDLEVCGIYLIFRDISEQAEQADAIKYLAFHDQLTGLLNRRSLYKDLNSILNRGKENRRNVAVLSIDIDRFKHLNDKLGHSVGDELIRKVANRLVKLSPTSGYVYRHSGDEFTIVLENCNEKIVDQFAKTLLKSFKQPFYYENNEYFLSLSVGISMFPKSGTTVDELLKNADSAMFAVKQQGRANYKFYEEFMNIDNKNIVEMGAFLHKALENNELSILFQPQVHLKSKEINSFEILLRWYNENLGHVSPAEFIPLAEDLGLIIPIGKWVIEEACKYVKRWNDKGYKDFKVAINISPRQFEQNLISVLRDSIEYYNISPESIEIEITEGILGNVDEAIPILEQVKELGITISVDDFGTGYSSLNYLKNFPIDILKIDRTFVKDVVTNSKDAAIATTIIHLGRSLGMEVIAEGIETKEQATFLRENHCHKAQGFYFAKPLHPDEIEALLAESM